MKVVIPVLKPRARQLNAVLVAKRCERHADERHPSRAKTKQEILKQVRHQFQEW